MADKPILFSGPMVRALLAGVKTQTRRTLTKPKWADAGSDFEMQADGAYIVAAETGCTAKVPLRIAVGDRLYVRENFSGPHGCRRLPPRDWPVGAPIWHWAGGAPLHGDWTMPKPGMHMPRWASRLTLTVTDVRIERLQDISRGDAMEEGCPFPNMAAGPNPRDWYAALWDEINGPGSWAANPWVVAYTFTVHHTNIDQMEAA